MLLTFTRGENRTYTTTALREDGVLLEVKGSDRKFPIPHDLAHCIVERELGLQRGFWGRIAAGGVYSSVKVLSGRQPPRAAERSRAILREEEQQGVEAEVLVGVMLTIMHGGLENDAAKVQALLKNEWRPSKPERSSPSLEEVQRTCAALREAERQWQTLEEGQAMSVTWHGDRRSKRSNRGFDYPG